MRLLTAVRRIASDLDALGARFALVGGLAVSVHVEPRTTRDVDVVVSVEDDAAAERLVYELSMRGYRLLSTIEHTGAHRLATARFVRGKKKTGPIVDLLFASSGVEPEIVAGAERVTLARGLEIPVAGVGDLVSMKILARDDERRPLDAVDLRALLAECTESDLTRARALLELIAERGFSRGKDLRAELDRALEARR